jgi:glycine/D-amino acid oxidase-like deaminating enzyme
MIPPPPTPDSDTGTARRPRAWSPVLPLLVIGGGIAGSSLFHRLAQHGVQATLLERGQIGRQGASAVGAALLNPYRGRSGKPGQYDLEGLAAFWRLTAQLQAAGHDPGARRSGVLRVASGERQARAWGELPGLLRQPELPPPYRAPQGAFLVPEGGWVEPHRLLAALVDGAAARGGELIEECGVERLERQTDAWRAHTSRGMFRARTVVLATGADTIGGVRLPEMERVEGDQVTLASEAPLPYPIAGPIYLASTGTRVLVGGNHRSPGTPDPQAPQLLRASAARMVPPLAEAPVTGVWTGVRAKCADNLPLAVELEPDLWFLGAFGGRGFLTAPLLAERLAATLAGDP